MVKYFMYLILMKEHFEYFIKEGFRSSCCIGGYLMYIKDNINNQAYDS